MGSHRARVRTPAARLPPKGSSIFKRKKSKLGFCSYHSPLASVPLEPTTAIKHDSRNLRKPRRLCGAPLVHCNHATPYLVESSHMEFAWVSKASVPMSTGRRTCADVTQIFVSETAASSGRKGCTEKHVSRGQAQARPLQTVMRARKTQIQPPHRMRANEVRKGRAVRHLCGIAGGEKPSESTRVCFAFRLPNIPECRRREKIAKFQGGRAPRGFGGECM